MKRVLFCAAMIAWSGMASAEVYKWVDAQGKLQYGDRPPIGVHAELVEGLGGHAAHVAPARSTDSVTASQTTKPAAHEAAPQEDSAKAAVANDVAATRDKQCADAQDRYKKLIEGRRLYKAGADGERQYLSSEEIDAERVNAKHELDAICNSDT